MTDREALEELLRRFGLTAATQSEKTEGWSERSAVCLVAGEGGVDGYGGFINVFKFDADGKFESLYLWE